MRRTLPFHIPTLLLCPRENVYRTILLCIFSLSLGSIASVQAQTGTSPITSSGLNTTVAPNGNIYIITGGTRPGGGSNLFHSFGEFGVPTIHTASFLNSGSIDIAGNVLSSNLPTSNILARVTGGNPSSIFGVIQTNGAGGFGNANLFVMNPAGFLFGPNATVNVSGMVAFTSADYLRLQGAGGDGIFYADSAANSVLTSAPVATYGFLGSNPGAITVQGSQLSVTPGQSISLVGGNITVQSGTPDGGPVQSAKLSASGGQINLAGVASPGEILVSNMNQIPNINSQSFDNLGAIQISEQSVIDVSGNGGGTVLIRGGQFLLDSSSISANTTGPGPVVDGEESIGGGIDIQMAQSAVLQNGALIDTSVIGNATPGVTYGGVQVKVGGELEIRGSVDLENFIFTSTFVQSNVAEDVTGGRSGNVRLEANSILLKDFGQAQTGTSGAGDAGNVLITANQNLVVDGGGNISSTSSFGSGNAGNIELTSTHGNILVSGGFVSSQAVRSSGNSGSITVNAPEGDIILSGNEIFGPGVIFTETNRATGILGGIHVTAKNLQLLDGSNIEVVRFNNVTTLIPGSIDVTLSGN